MIRSLLYVPASSERSERVIRSWLAHKGVDAPGFVLENGSGGKNPPRGRLAAVPAVAQRGGNGVRAHHPQPELMRPDAEAACRAGAFGLLVPKARRRARCRCLRAWLEEIEHSARRAAMIFIPMIEDAGAVCSTPGPSQQLPRASLDWSRAERIWRPRSMPSRARRFSTFPSCWSIWPQKQPVCARSAYCARSPTMATSLRSRKAPTRHAHWGSTVRAASTPSVVPVLNRAFSPSAEALDHARRLVAAAADAKTRGKAPLPRGQDGR